MVENPFPHAEVALILSGDPLARSLAARELYTQGRVNQILVIPEPPEPFEEELHRLGLKKAGEPQWPERIFLASGIPEEKFVFLPEPAEGTVREALLTRQFLRGKFPSSLVLVTGAASTRRAGFVFRWLLRKEKVQIFCYPCAYDSFQPKRWWRYPRSALLVVTEYEKLLANVLTLLFQPKENIGEKP